MATYTIKCTFAFSGYDQGWSETLYFQQATASLEQAANIADSVAVKRAFLLGGGYKLTNIRVATTMVDSSPVKRRVELREPRYGGNSAANNAPPAVALQCRFESQNTEYYKLLFMRGIWGDIEDNGREVVLAPGWLSAFNSWREAVISLNWGWLRSVEVARRIITNYVMDPVTGYVTVTLDPTGEAMPWNVGVGEVEPVEIALPGRTPLDGVHPVRVLSPYSFVFNKPIGVKPFSFIGTAALNSLTFTGLNPGGDSRGQIHPQRITERKVGRPTYAARGRVAVRPTW